jgi:hypothetical protein
MQSGRCTFRARSKDGGGMVDGVVKYESKENAGHRFWMGRYGRYAIRIDANRPGVYRWLITLEGHTIGNCVAPDRAGQPPR